MRQAAAPLAAVVVVAAGWWMLSTGGGGETARSQARTGPTATVERRTLVEREDVDGTLGYSGRRTVLHRSAESSSPSNSDPRSEEPSSSSSTTLTRVARPGSIVRRGSVLYRANGKPVVLMYGSRPAFRSLSVGVADGDDVRRLEANLVALGFGTGAVEIDRHFSDATAEAVRAWQHALGLEQTGEVELGRVVFLPGPRRMGAAVAGIGTALADGSEVVETTSTHRVVKVELDASKQSLVRKGGRVTVTLPDGRTVGGRISAVGRVAREQDSADESGLGGGDSGTLVIDVSVRVARTRGIGRLDQAPVTVGIARESRRRVLAVPVTALLARTGGGYAVEVVGGSGRGVVPVETGLFAAGLVEISGRGIGAGTEVAVAG